VRTTLTIEDNLAWALKALAHHSGEPFEEVVNEILRAGLTVSKLLPAPRAYSFKPDHMVSVRADLNLDKVLALADRLEDGAQLRAAITQVILVYAYLLIYKVHADSAQDPTAHQWLEQSRSDSTEVALAWIVILAFLRKSRCHRGMKAIIRSMNSANFLNRVGNVPRARTTDQCSQPERMRK